MQAAGIHGPNGWVLKNQVFDNGYYAELVGGQNPANDTRGILINDAPPWQRAIQTSNGNGFPDQRFWKGTPNGVDIVMVCTLLVMSDCWISVAAPACLLILNPTLSLRSKQLNSDMALVRHLDSSNMDPTLGRVSCTFTNATSSPPAVLVCPYVSGALIIASAFKADNIKWLKSFRNVLGRMLTHGYNTSSSSCQDAACKIVPV
jgi:hypothetical protein